jgi:PAS domain S-box-containing protein
MSQMLGPKDHGDEERSPSPGTVPGDPQSVLEANGWSRKGSRRTIRVGALLVIAFQVAYLAADIYLAPGAVRATLPLHAVNISIAAVLLACTWTNWLGDNWKPAVWLGCICIILSTQMIARADRNGEALFVSVLLFVMGTGTLVPWERHWQVGLEAGGLLAIVFQSTIIPLDAYQWLAALTTVCLAHTAHELISRNRRLIAEGLERQLETQANLHEKIAELEDLHRRERAGQEALRVIIESSPDVITINRVSDGAYVHLNREFESTGFRAAESVGQSPAKLALWADRAQLNEYLAELTSHKRVRNFEAGFRRKDGTIVPCLISGVMVELNGEPCIVSYVRDITNLKRADTLVRGSETMLRRIFDATPDIVTITRSSDGSYVRYNQEALRTGFTADEFNDNSAESLKVWAHSEERVEFLRRIAADGIARNMEVSFRYKDGTVVPSLISAVPIELEGEPCILSIVRDIRALKQADLRVRESEATLRTLFDQNLDSMMILDLERGRYIDVNQEYMRHTGYSRDEVVGKRSRELQSLAIPEDAERMADELRRSGVVRNMEASLRRKDGSTYTGLISAVVLTLGGRRCCLTITRDISALKETQRELIEAREAALAAARAKSEFLASMSHEIRTPMNAVLGMAELLWETELGEEQRRFVNIMRANGDALLDLINDILDLAKIESGRLNLEHVEFDLEELVGKLGEMMGVRAHEKGVELAVRLAPGVPHKLVGDPLRLRQILVNLLGNAVKFTERGQIVLTVEQAQAPAATSDRTRRNGTPGDLRLRFSVRDTGIGIARDKLGVIFSSFSQADSSTTRSYGGSGLGLAIAGRLVELYGGEIAVQSEPGVGSCFSFTAQFGDAGESREAAHSDVAPDLRGLRVLIVDDTEVNRLILRETLAPAGAIIREAENGQQALDEIERALAAGQPYRLVVLDCRMPGMDGIDVVRRLRRIVGDDKRPPIVVMLTSDDLSVQPARLRELGIHTYLVKPVKRKELLDAVRRALSEDFAAATLPFPAAGGSAIALPPLRILLADDSRDNRLLVRAYFANSPVQLAEAENGRIAVDLFKQNTYDLVLMDMRMPEMDGYTATRAIRAWETERHLRRTPVIALTASALDEAVRGCLEAGCDLHVSKPVKRAVLFEAIVQMKKNAAAAASVAPGNGAHGASQPAVSDGQTPHAVVDEALRDLIPEFLRSKRADMADVLHALERGDYPAVSHVAHQLKGEGGAYGFPEVTDLGRELEDAAKRTDPESALRLARQLAQYLEKVEVSYQS